MTNIDFLTTKDGILLGFNIRGHANFDKRGNDIVCSAVSSVAFYVANTLIEILKIPVDVQIDETYGLMNLKIDLKYSIKCQDFLLGLKLHLLNLEEQYPKYISVNYVEV